MPELPEVETVVREVTPFLVGQRVTAVEVSSKALRHRWQPAWSDRLIGRRVEAVTRRGKWIIVQLDDGSRLLIHLGMTGQLTVVSNGSARRNHTHVVLGLNAGARELRFRDVRRFGSIRLVDDQDSLDRLFGDAGLGPEPLSVPAIYWRERLTQTSRCVKAILLDQRVVAGVGNIYADEALFEAKLHPARLGRTLTPVEAARLRHAVAKVLRKAITRRGSTIRDYVGGTGAAGGYQKEFRVYGRTEQPCHRCGERITRIRLAGRSTHYCPSCQPQDV